MKRVAALLAAACVGLAGCAGLSAADLAPRTDPMARLVPAEPSPWTEDLGDPTLAGLLRRADAGALDVKLALARLERAQAETEEAAAAGRPTLTVGAAAGVGGDRHGRRKSAGTPTLEATYELDLWGRIARGRDAAASEQRAAASDVAAARLLVGAETVRAYLAARAAQADVEATGRARDLAEEALALTQTRAGRGAATDQEVAARRRDLAATEAQLEQARAAVALETARLGDLVDAKDLALPSGALPAPAVAAASTDSAKVDRRPDVQAAFARLTAADARRAAAVAATRPQFQIVAALGSPDAALATLLDVKSLVWAAAASLTQSVLDGGLNRAKVHEASAEADMADIAYRQTVVAGWSQMRAGLAAEAQALREVQLAEAGLGGAQAALRTGEARHTAGAIDGLAMVALRSDVERADAALRTAQVRAAEARVERVLAAGG